MTHFDVILVGSGFGSLSAASMLAKEGLKVMIMEQNYLPGGCTSSYWRKGFVFEAGATTVVGVDEGMPLNHLLQSTGIDLRYKKLTLPMEVHLKNGTIVKKFQPINQWIDEAIRVFGQPEAQRKFWKKCYEISQFVWGSSMKQRHFPPSSWSDLASNLQSLEIDQVRNVPYSLMTMDKFLQKYGLDQNKLFVEFVNEQLLITAQNYLQEVNVLFGAAALCYTNYTNCYIDGGLINLVNPFIRYIESKGGKIELRNPVITIKKTDRYYVATKKGTFSSEFLISGIPVNNTLKIFHTPKHHRLEKKILQSGDLNSAFQMGIGFKTSRKYNAIHHQIHLSKPLTGTQSNSIFLSLNHEKDDSRSDLPGCRVASVSTHIKNPAENILDKGAIVEEILDVLDQKGYVTRDEIIYSHASTQKSWEKWTGRQFGFVGGYPQLKRIKPWQMLDARLDGHKAYLCGDTSYPGQGIPGVALSGIIAYEKLKKDWL